MAPAWTGQRVELRAAVVLGRLPLGRDPASLFQLVQRGIERAIADLEDVTGHLLEALADRPAVKRLEREDFQNQEVQGALHQVRRLAHRMSSRLPRTHLYRVSSR